MSQLGHPFYGLTLTPEDRVGIADEIFQLCYYGNGFSHDEVYSMPIYRRRFYLRRLIQEKENEKKAQEEDSTPKQKIARAPVAKKS
jgi:hypothetical protein